MSHHLGYMWLVRRQRERGVDKSKNLYCGSHGKTRGRQVGQVWDWVI